jgi:HEAT repeat protein
MRTLALLVLVPLLSGCRNSEPPLSGGKPISHWIETLQDPSPKVRKQAVTKLGNAGSADPAVLPAVMEALKDTDAEVRCEAILALMKLGPAARDAIVTLTQMQRVDHDDQVRSFAAKALQKLQAAI